MIFPLHSIRWRIQAWHGLILFFAIGAFCLTAHRLAWDNQLRQVDNELERTMGRNLFRLLSRERKDSANADPPPTSPAEFFARLRAGKIKITDEVAAIFHGTETGYAYFRIDDTISKETLLSSDNFPKEFNWTLPENNPALSEPIEAFRIREQCREFAHASPNGINVFVGRDISAEMESLNRYAWSIALCGIGVWALGLLGGWWLAGRAIRPVQKISTTAARIADGNLSERIDLDGTENELDQLSRILNSTFERLHNAFERQRQFTADASHELRTPVTILLSETQRALKRERTPEEYRAIIETCNGTAQRMRHLIEALLLLARQETEDTGAHSESCDLAQILDDVQRHLVPIATDRNIQLHAELKNAAMKGNPTAISILATNLLANAITHHHPNDKEKNIYISTGSDDDGTFFTIRDDGPGIPEQDLPHIFERFYRADKARTGNSGHTGLGLAIAKVIADNHGADISVQSLPGKGSVFSVHFRKKLI
ncbi:MAG: HAMP domain-containing protein [Puniceicoccales bacterium]|jgi:heavy metal sensor kinase|nr:HAMP domain-containing protein [Puniceicoccales bacterium]